MVEEQVLFLFIYNNKELRLILCAGKVKATKFRSNLMQKK